jgi:hypothetical protein
VNVNKFFWRPSSFCVSPLRTNDLLVILTVRVTWKTTGPARAAGIITLIGLVVLAFVLTYSPGKKEFINHLAVRAYDLAQLAAVALITVTTVEVVIRAFLRNISFAGALARLAFAYLPLAHGTF